MPAGSVQHKARRSEHVAGRRITLGMNRLDLPGAVDLTDALRAAAAAV